MLYLSRLSLVTIALLPLTNHASDFIEGGARYKAQGGVSVANSNDVFALITNPTNLLTHSNAEGSEYAMSFQQVQNVSPQGIDDGNSVSWQYIGGASYSSKLVYGGYMAKANKPIFIRHNKNEKLAIIYPEQWAFAIAYGNESSENTLFNYGIGASIDAVIATDDNGTKFNSADYNFTFSGKVATGSQWVLQTHTIDYEMKLAASYSTEELTNEVFKPRITIRPEIARLGTTLNSIILGPNSALGINFSAEVLTKNYSFIDEYTAANSPQADELHVGAEVNFYQFFSSDLSLALRYGQITYLETELASRHTAGFGISGEKWSFDFSVQDAEVTTQTQVYDISISYSL